MRLFIIIACAIIGSMSLIFFSSWIQETETNYGITSSGNDLMLIQQLNESYNFSISTAQELESGVTTIGQTGVSDTSLMDQLGLSLKVFANSFKFIPKMVNTLGSVLKLPGWFVGGFMALLILAMVIGLIALWGSLRYGGLG